jgi:hypothetical protein
MGNFRLRSRNLPERKRHLRNTFSRIGTHSNSSSAARPTVIFCTSVIRPGVFVSTPNMFMRVRKAEMFETLFVADVSVDARRRMLFGVFVGKFRAELVLGAEWRSQRLNTGCLT